VEVTFGAGPLSPTISSPSPKWIFFLSSKYLNANALLTGEDKLLEILFLNAAFALSVLMIRHVFNFFGKLGLRFPSSIGSFSLWPLYILFFYILLLIFDKLIKKRDFKNCVY
jgi:hypothetical protein